MPRGFPLRQTAGRRSGARGGGPAGGSDVSGALVAEWRFIAGTALMALLAHAACYLIHEYCHAFAAWVLGFKHNPLAIDYGDSSLANLLFQQQIDENVNYGPIFAGHHDLAAAAIAFAGPGIGNGVVYGMLLYGFRRAVARHRRGMAMMLYWPAVFSAGNVWSYAPTRTITTHGDMALVARGLHLDPWVLLPLVTLPSLLILLSVFRWLFPGARATFLAPNPVRIVLVAALTGWVLFGFFGGLDLSGHYGPVPALLSVVSVLVALPVSVAWFLLGSPAMSTRDPDAPICAA